MMKTMAGEFAIPDVVPTGKYAGARIADLPTEDLGFVLRDHRRLPTFVQAVDIELRRRKRRGTRLAPPRKFGLASLKPGPLAGCSAVPETSRAAW